MRSLRTARGRHQATRTAPARAVSAVVAVVALLAVQLTLLTVAPDTTATAATPGKGAPFDCYGGTVYNVQSTSGSLNALDTSTLGSSSVTATAITTVPSEANANALAITTGGAAAYTVRKSATGTTTSLYRYDATAQSWHTFTDATSAAGDTYVAGAFDPFNHIYYYATYAGATATVYGWNTATDTPIAGVVASIDLPITSGSENGDMAFDLGGNLYLVESVGTNVKVAVVRGPLPTTGADTPMASTVLDTLPDTGGYAFNGIAFDNLGYLYAEFTDSSSFTYLQSLNPNTGATQGAATKQGLVASGPGVDLAACSLNPTVTVKTKVVGRSQPGDQFTMSVTGGGITQGDTGTTTGTGTSTGGAQAGPVIAVSGTTYTVADTAASGSLAHYTSTYACTDAAAGDRSVASGSGTSFDLAFPNPATGATGPYVTCTFTLTPKPAALDTVTTVKTVNGVVPTASTPLTAGDKIVYNVATTNTGGTDGTTTLTDTVPAGTTYSGSGEGWSAACSPGAAAGTSCTQAVTVPVGQTVTTTFTATVDTPLPGAVKSVPDTVTSSTGGCSACTAIYPVAPILDTVTSVATINGSAATAATPVRSGDTVRYDLAVTNVGGAGGSTVLTDQVPALTTYTGSGEGWTCPGSAPGSSCTQTVPVPAGGSATRSYTVTVGALPTGTQAIADSVTSATGTCSACSVSNPTAAVLDTVKTITTVNGTAATPATQVGPGDVLGYDITTTNTGGSAGTTVLSDSVPANTTYTGTGQGWSCSAPAASGAACTQTVTVAADGATVTKSYTVTVASPLPAGTHSIANLVHSSDGTCSACNPSNPTVGALDTVKTLASVDGAPATAGTPVKAGDVLVYQVKVTNTGGTTASTTLSDDVPANTSYAGSGEGWSCAAPAAAGTACTQSVTVAGDDASVTVTYTVTVGAFPAGTLAIGNEVTTSNGTCSACSPSNPTVAVLDTTEQVLTVDGTPASPTTPIAAGDVVTYEMTVHNTGGAPGTTLLSDPVPANTSYTGSGQGWSCSTGATAGSACTRSVTAPGGSTVTEYYTVTVAAPLPANTATIDNTLTSGSGTCSACSVGNPTAPVLDTVKTVSTVNGAPATSSTALAAGDAVTYTVTTTNTGGTTGTTLLSDTVPANTTFTGSATQGWSCRSGAVAGTACTQSVTVAAGSTATESYTATVVTAVPSGTTTITNVVTSSGGTCSACSVSNPTVAALDTVKTLSTVNGAAADASTQLDAGDHLTYQITTTNQGGASGSTSLTETVPAHTTFAGIPAQGWSCASGATAGTTCTHAVTVSPGRGVGYYFQVTVDSPLPDDVASIDNTVTSTSGTCSACSTTNLIVAKLDTVKTITAVNGAPATAATAVTTGDVVEYTITTHNAGGASATTTLSDTVPAHLTYTGSAEGWSCTDGSAAGAACTQLVTVPGGSSTAVTSTLTVGALPTGTLTVDNHVTSSVGTCSACTASNPTAAVLTTTKSVATVNGSAATTATQLSAGDVVSYRITTTNTGGSAGTTSLSDVVPADTTYSGTGEGWSCAMGSAAASICLQSVTVPSQGSVSTAYTLTVVTPLPAGTQTIANSVTSSSGACPACTATNPTIAALDTLKTVVSVNGAPATATTPVHAGDEIGYAVQVTNTGGSAGTTTLTDVVPAHTSYSGVGEGWSCAAGAAAGTTCTQTVTVGANASATRAYTVTVGALPAGTTAVTNTVTSSSGTCSSCGVSSPTGGLLSTVKTIATVNGTPAGPSTALAAGDVVVYHLAVTNTGGASSATTLSDPVPANTTYTGGSGEGWSCTAPAAAGSGCTRTVTAGAGATVTANYTLTVVTPLPTGTQTIVNTATSNSGTCSACTATNPTVAALTTVKTVTTVNGTPATAATPVGPGDVIGYSVRVTNTGGSSGTTTLSDPVPAHTSYTGGSGEGWSCTAPAPAATACTQDVSVPADDAVTTAYTVTVGPLPSGTLTLTNTVAASNSTCSACSVSNPTVAALDTVKTVTQVDGVTATTATPVRTGDTITYALTVDNTGGSAGTTTLTETVPAHTSYSGGSGEGWTCGITTCTQDVTAPAATPVTKTFTVTVGALPPGTASIANSVASRTGTCSACSVSNPTVPTLDTVKTVAAVNGDLTATAATPVGTGDTITYDLTVTNSGGAAGPTTLTETIPANTRYSGAGSGELWTCTAGSCTQNVTVPGGTAVTRTFTVTVLALPSGTQTITNTVVSSSGTCSACSVSNPTVAHLDTVKTVTQVDGNAATAATPVQAGDTITYAITVTNSGGSPGTTTLTDAVPANTTYTGSNEGWDCTVGPCTRDVTVGADDSATATYTVTVVNPLPVGTLTISNVAASSTGTCSACSVSNPTIAALDTVKMIRTVNGSAATASTALRPGDVVVYSIVVTNTGGSPASTTLTETVPANTTYTGSGEGWTCANRSVAGTACSQGVTVGAGSSVTTPYTVTVGPLPKGTQTVANTVGSSNGTCSACSVSNPTVPVLDTVKTIGSIDGDTSATPATQVAAGDVIVYTITVTNTGGSAGSTTLTDVVPANTSYAGSGEGWSCVVGSCTHIVTVPAAGSVTTTFTVTVANPLTDGVRTVTNTVAASNGTCSACTVTNPTVAALHTVKRLVTIDALPTTPAQQVKPGDVMVYSMTVTNGGGSAGTTTLTDAVPADTTYTGASTEGWTCSATTALSPCTQDVTVAPGASVQRLFTMTLDTPLPTGLQTVANTVGSSLGTCVPCSVVSPTVGTLSVSKTITKINGAPATAGDQVRAGDVLTYAIRAVNTGGASATTRLSDQVPADATYTGRGEGWSCTAPAVTGTSCTQDVTIDPARTRTVTYTMTVATPLPKGTAAITNTVMTAQGSCTLCTATNPTIATLDTVKTLATVDGRPVVGSARVQGGDVLGYTVTVANTGGSPLSTTLTETVPAHTTYTGNGEGWSCAPSSPSGARCVQSVLVPPQTTVTKRFTVAVDSPVASGTRQLVNVVTTSNGTCSACRVTTPLAVADIVVTKTADRASASIGQQLTFTVRVHNNGPDGATDLTVTDRPTGLRYVSSTVTRGTFDPRSGVWTIGALESSADAVLQASYVITSSGASNSATADNPAQRDPVYSNDVSAVAVTGPGGGGGLASTGVPTWTLIRDAVLLLLTGCALLFAARRRRGRHAA